MTRENTSGQPSLVERVGHSLHLVPVSTVQRSTARAVSPTPANLEPGTRLSVVLLLVTRSGPGMDLLVLVSWLDCS